MRLPPHFTLAHWGKLEPKRAPYLPASYVLSSSSASSWKPTLAQTSPCLSVKPSLNWITWSRIHTRSNKDFSYILTRAHSLKYVAIQGSWLKLWDTALDYGAGGTRHGLAILRALTTPLFGDRLCPAPQCTYPVIENTNTFLNHIMEHLWTNAHPPTPETLFKLVTDNPERALQAGWHIHRILFVQWTVNSAT